MQTLMEELQFPEEAVRELWRIRQTLPEDVFVPARALMIVCKVQDYLPILAEISQSSGIPKETIDLLFLLECAGDLRQIYREKDLPDRLFLDSMEDLTCKLWECRRLTGNWGTTVLHWYPCFFQCGRFKLGRLQYEQAIWTEDSLPGIVRRGEKLHRCHIPSCGPCTIGAVEDSLARAYDFYRAGKTPEKLLKVVCSSWMLYAPLFPLFPEGSNLDGFRRLFRIVRTKHRGFSDAWRIFGVNVSAPEDLDRVPQETGLQRRLKAHLLAGGTMGGGTGILLFDGKTILTRE